MRCRPALQKNPNTRGQPPEPAPSGPNSVPTNQTTPAHHVPHPQTRAVLAATREAGRTSQRSTLEHHPRNPRPSEDRMTVTP